MIVRVLTNGQYRVPDSARGRLNELDEAAYAAARDGDPETFHARYDELLDFVRSEGEELADESLESSDVILPPADVTIAEALRELSPDGLIPD